MQPRSKMLLSGEEDAYRWGVDWSNRAAAVIPCHDEAAWISGVVRQVRRVLSKVFVVDDGSLDTTADCARGAGAEVVHLRENCGKGAALAVGMNRAAQLGYEWVLTLDGDGQHDAAEASRFFAAVERENVSLVVGNRMGEAGRMPRIRRVTNRLMSGLISAGCGQRLPDTQCGFRLMQLEAWSGLPLRSARFEVESEWLVAWLARGWPVAFVPISTVYRSGASKIHPVADTLRWIIWFLGSRSRLSEARRRRARVCLLRA